MSVLDTNEPSQLPDLNLGKGDLDTSLTFVKEMEPSEYLESVVLSIPQSTLERVEWLLVTGQAMDLDHALEILYHLTQEVIPKEALKYHLARNRRRLIQERRRYLDTQQAFHEADYDEILQSPAHTRYARLALTLAARTEGQLIKMFKDADMCLDEIKEFAAVIKSIQAIDPVINMREVKGKREAKREENKAQIADLVSGFMDRVAEFQAEKDPRGKEQGNQSPLP